MKILYGVQGTGNGHITRARTMAEELSKCPLVEVDYLFSGKKTDQYFDMNTFGKNVQYKKGLTFTIDNGTVNLFKTVINNDYIQFLKDIKSIDTSKYDIIISDYEPITAWAAKISGKRCIGIGHQYAFYYDIPMDHSNIVLLSIMKYFAPVDIPIGLHWNNFGNKMILPPIIDNIPLSNNTIKNKIVVYLSFEDINSVAALLSQFPEYDFHVYGTTVLPNTNHIFYNYQSRDNFMHDLKTCNGVICNAGFELVSECLLLGKKFLVKPVSNQMEQHSNAAAVNKLQIGMTMENLDPVTVREFLHSPTPSPIQYQNVAEYLVNWIVNGADINDIAFNWDT